MGEQPTGTLAKRRFIFDLGVGGPDQDVIDKLEAAGTAGTIKELIVNAVRQYREEEAHAEGKGDPTGVA